MATLKDVAAECGLTVTTVSRVLNNRGYISDKTRKKVYEAMAKLNYRPNEVARSLSKKTTNTIGVIVPHIRHPYFAEMISNIENAASKHGYKIILCNSKGRNNKEKEYLDMCTSNRVAGIILFSGSVAVQEFTDSNIALVTVERFVENGTAAVECDNKQGGELAAQHLIDCGCKRLLHVSGILNNSMPADDRALGFIEVCEKNGVFYKVVATNMGQYNSLDYHDMLEGALEYDEEIDGVFASSDLIASQILQVCSKLGKRVPEDIKIVGFDDVMISQITNPPISTIHQPIKEMAEAAVDMVIAASEGKMVPKRTLLPVTLVKREST
ncbi:LacI family DNA-binding transcriptional regulator [Pseudobutyrivibrio ruminis]|uniref:LacI family DNA-binding transcriptional regulator n=1 Tax=Pseudobutyrivibrio ruminis TaxID=46206 RepID=UPI00051BF1F6|nr:LacI family DNA-binding transcriptional regulator [Pseudobutyrivibrio ruminis]